MTETDFKIPKEVYCMASYIDGQWFVKCLNFNLGAQDDTFEGACQRVKDQVKLYIDTATTLDNGVHAEQLLNRRAPWWEWVLFYLSKAIDDIFCKFNKNY